MKIGLIAHLKHPIRSPFAGGLEAFTFDICRRLTARGHEVILFASSKSDPSLSVYPILNDDHYNDSSGYREKRPNLSSEYMAEHHAYMDLMQHIDAMGLDLIFNNSLHYVPITMAGILKTPFLTVLHTPPFFELKNAVLSAGKSGKLKYITVSQRNADNWLPFTKACTVIQNGIDLESWNYNPAPTGKYAIWFGRIHPDKGTHLAIKAAKLAGIPLKIAGTIADEKYYKMQIEPILDQSVEYLGHKNHSELNELIGNAIVSLITPTWEEPFGLVVAESLACGTPVAGFAIGALPGLITDETGILVPALDFNALAGAIETASKKDRHACRAHANACFAIEKMIDAYEDQFNAVTNAFQLHQSDIYR